MTAPRLRDTLDKSEMDKVVDDFMTQGYEIKSQGETNTLLKKRSWGSAGGWVVSIIAALFLTFFTVGLSWIIPIAYAIYAHYTAPEVLVRRPL